MISARTVFSANSLSSLCAKTSHFSVSKAYLEMSMEPLYIPCHSPKLSAYKLSVFHMLGVSGNLNVGTRCDLDQCAYQIFPVVRTITLSAHACHGPQGADRPPASSDRPCARYQKAYGFSDS